MHDAGTLKKICLNFLSSSLVYVFFRVFNLFDIIIVISTLNKTVFIQLLQMVVLLVWIVFLRIGGLEIGGFETCSRNYMGLEMQTSKQMMAEMLSLLSFLGLLIRGLKIVILVLHFLSKLFISSD